MTILYQDTQKNMRQWYKEHPFKYKGMIHLLNYKLLYHPQAECIDIDKKGRLAFKTLIGTPSPQMAVEKAKKKHIITACIEGNELIVWHKPTRKQKQVIKQMFVLKIINQNALDCLQLKK